MVDPAAAKINPGGKSQRVKKSNNIKKTPTPYNPTVSACVLLKYRTLQILVEKECRD